MFLRVMIVFGDIQHGELMLGLRLAMDLEAYEQEVNCPLQSADMEKLRQKYQRRE